MSGSRRLFRTVDRAVARTFPPSGDEGHTPLVAAVATEEGVLVGWHLFNSEELQAELDALGGGPTAVAAIVDPARPDTALVIVGGSFHLFRLPRVAEASRRPEEPAAPP